MTQRLKQLVGDIAVAEAGVVADVAPLEQRPERLTFRAIEPQVCAPEVSCMSRESLTMLMWITMSL